MTTVGGLFYKYSSVANTRVLCEKLNPLLHEGASPKEVKCTKRVYSCLAKHLDTAVANSQYDFISTLFNTLSHVANSSRDQSSGFHKFITFGLPGKHIESWCDELLTHSQDSDTDEQWGKMVDSVLFSLTVVLGVSTEEDQEEMVSLLTPLLMCVCNSSLPCSARIEAARGSNILLEVCSVKFKTDLIRKPEIEQLILSMGKFIQNAGDFELQVSIVECLYRMTSATERASLTAKWFNNAPSSVIQRFISIREAEFEVDCRSFLNELNSGVVERTVYSLSCMRLFCGTFELHCPQDASHFWVDFNTGSRSVTVFVDDPSPIQSNTKEEESVWEMITIKDSAVVNWAVKVFGRENVLSISLKNPAHSLLPSMPSSSSHEILIRFNSVCDPTQPALLAFGASKQSSPTDKSSVKHTKQSSAIKSVHINQSSAHKQADLQEISPIESSRNTPALGGHVDSQGSNTTPKNKSVASTPATSTPKPHHLKSLVMDTTVATNKAYITPSSSGHRPPLTFISSGACVGARKREGTKSSMAVNSVLLSKGRSKVIQIGGTSTGKEDQSTSTSIQQTVKRNANKASRVSKNKKQQKVSEVQEKKVASSKLRTTTPTSWTTTSTSGRKCLSKLTNFRKLESPEDTCSPALDYNMPTAAVLKRLQSQEESSTTKCNEDSKLRSDLDPIDLDPYKLPEDDHQHDKTSSSHSTPTSLLSNVTNRSSEGRKHREFNLSGVSTAHAKKSKARNKRSKSRSRNSSLNSTRVSELCAIPDSLPTGCSPTMKPHSPKTGTKAKRKPLKLNRSKKNFFTHSESEDETDESWRPAKGNKEPSKVDSKSKVEPTKTVSSRSSARQQTSKKADQNTKPLIVAPAPRNFKSQIERQQFIDEVYDNFSTLDLDTTETVSRKKQKRLANEVCDLPDADPSEVKATKPPPKVPQKENLSKQVSTSKVSKPSSKAKPRNRRASPPLKSRPTRSKPKSLRTKPQKPPSKSNSRNQHSSPAKTHGSKTRKRRVVNYNNDFDDLLLSHLETKKHCPEQNQSLVSRYFPSPVHQNIEREEQSFHQDYQLSYSPIQSPVMEQQNESFINHTSISCASETASLDEPIKDKVLDTQETEKACIPNLPKKSKNPGSPSVSTHSSQITADPDITAEFQQICQALITKSGTKLGIESKKVSNSYQAKIFPKTPEREADLSEHEEGSIASDVIAPAEQGTISLTQLTRDIVNSHQMDAHRASMESVQPRKSRPKSSTLLVEKKLPPLLSEEHTIRFEPATTVGHQENMAIDEDGLSVSGSKSSVGHQESMSTSSEGNGSEPQKCLDMRDLVNLFGGKLLTSERVKCKKFTSKNNSEELLQLWHEHQKQREGALSVYQHQLLKELEVLGKDVQQIQDTEKQTMHVMKKRLQTLKQSVGSQQNQVDRLRTLQVSFYQHLGKLEESQSSEQLGVHRSLRQEMHSLQKKLLVDYERKEVLRIKESLHAMLLQVS